MCSNHITITGDDLTNIRKAFEQAEAATQGWLPEGMEGRWLFGVNFLGDDINEIIIQCETKWAPPTEELEAIGKMFNVNIANEYEEMGSHEYGKSDFRIKTMATTIVCLDEDDFARVVEHEDLYMFDGKIIESRYDAYDQMLREKLKLQNT